MRRSFAGGLALTVIFFLLGCRDVAPDPTDAPEAVPEATDAAAVLPEPTQTSPPTTESTQPPVNTPEPEAAAPTATSMTAAENATPTETPLATSLVEVTVRSAETDEPLGGASVHLVNETVGYDATVVTGANTGAASFTGMEPTTTSIYTLSVFTPGFGLESMEIVVERGLNEVEVALEPGIRATTTITSNLRSGPGLTYETLVEVPEGETVSAMAVGADEQWAQVRRSNGEEGWIFAELLAFEDDLNALHEAEAPPPPTATPVTVTGQITPTATITPGTTPTATATVLPDVETGELPPRPEAVAFEPVAFRDSMVALRSQLENMGFLLDLIENGDSANCEAYTEFFVQAATSPQFSGVPDEWQDLSQLYEDTITGVLTENADIFFICQGGDENVDITPFNRGRARTAIEQGVADLIEGIRVANALLEA